MMPPEDQLSWAKMIPPEDQLSSGWREVIRLREENTALRAQLEKMAEALDLHRGHGDQCPCEFCRAKRDVLAAYRSLKEGVPTESISAHGRAVTGAGATSEQSVAPASSDYCETDDTAKGLKREGERQ